MVSKKVQTLAAQYPLSKAEAQAGFDQAIENAQRFYNDARTLAQRDGFNSAVLLAIYAVDELGKAALMARSYLRQDKSQATWEEFYDSLMEHRRKFEQIQRYVSLFEGGFLLPDECMDTIVQRLADRVVNQRKRVAFIDVDQGRIVPPVRATEADCRQMLDRVGEVLDLVRRHQPRVHQMFAEAP